MKHWSKQLTWSEAEEIYPGCGAAFDAIPSSHAVHSGAPVSLRRCAYWSNARRPPHKRVDRETELGLTAIDLIACPRATDPLFKGPDPQYQNAVVFDEVASLWILCSWRPPPRPELGRMQLAHNIFPPESRADALKRVRTTFEADPMRKWITVKDLWLEKGDRVQVEASDPWPGGGRSSLPVGLVEGVHYWVSEVAHVMDGSCNVTLAGWEGGPVTDLTTHGRGIIRGA